MDGTIRKNESRGEGLTPASPAKAAAGGEVARLGSSWTERTWLTAAALLATVAFALLSYAGEAHAATAGSLALLQNFDPEGAAKDILKAFAFFIALIAIFVAVGRFARGAMMQGFGVLLAGGILFAVAAAPESLLGFGQWTLEQFGL